MTLQTASKSSKLALENNFLVWSNLVNACKDRKNYKSSVNFSSFLANKHILQPCWTTEKKSCPRRVPRVSSLLHRSVILEVKRLEASSFTPSLKQLHPGAGWKFFEKKTSMIQKQLGTKNNAYRCNLYVADKMLALKISPI